MKRLFFPALFVAGFVAAGTFSGVVIAGGTSTGTTTTTAATTTDVATTTEPDVTTTPTTTTSAVSPATLPAGVRVAGVRVGGLAPAAAVAAVEAAFARPLVVVVDRARLTLDPTRFATPYANTAVARARVSAPGSNAHLVVNVRGSLVRAWAARVAHRFARPSADATLVFANGKPRMTKERVGRALNAHKLVVRIVAALESNSRLPVHVKTRVVSPAVTAKSFGPDIVINRALNRLTLYDGARFVRSFPVATGQAIYPTPKGVFHIVVKWENPWWYPPTQDAWAKGLQPVPPGPDNPLGTRWMGLSAPGIGIHGTDEPTSIGYSASHGCIRMQVPDAEWLFTRVDIGTTVDII
ncbi:MAG TPA: L,D-transpeptidase family protein [Gaiellaceae bacterium]